VCVCGVCVCLNLAAVTAESAIDVMKCSVVTDWCCRLLDVAVQILLIYGRLIHLCGVSHDHRLAVRLAGGVLNDLDCTATTGL